MATVILQCHTCGKDFEKSSHEISRRKYKTDSPRWFCSRSCGTRYKNKIHPSKGPGPQNGNTYGEKYDPRFAWYVKRNMNDVRYRQVQDREVYAAHIASIWTGKCALTGVDLQLRDQKGKVGTENRFLIASIDRIDCSIPYQPGNVQWVSQAINIARNDRDLEAFKEDLKVLLR